MVSEVLIKIAGDAKEYKAELDKVRKNTEALEGQLASIAKISGAAFVGIAAAAAGAVFQFAKFDNQLRGVKTLLDENSFGAKGLEKGFAGMRKELLNLGASTGQDLGKLNKALFDTVSAGVDAAKAVEVVGTSAKLAQAGLTDVSTATDGITSALNAYSLSADQAEIVASKFFTAQKFGKTTIQELSNSIGQTAATANAFGVDLDQLLGSVAALTTGGIKTSQAFTGLNAVFAGVSKPTKEASDEAKRLGVEFNSTALRAKGLQGFLQSLTSSQNFNKQSIEKLFGSVEAQKVAFTLTGASAGAFDKTLKELTNTQKALNTLNAAADIQGQSLETSFNKLKTTVSNLAIQIGEKLAPFVQIAVDAFVSFINAIRENSLLVAFGAKLLIIGGIFTGVTTAVSLGTLAYIKMQTAIIALNAVMTVARIKAALLIGTVTLGIGTIIAFLPEIIQFTKAAFDAFSRSFGSIGDLAISIGKLLKAVFTFDFSGAKKAFDELKVQIITTGFTIASDLNKAFSSEEIKTPPVNTSSLTAALKEVKDIKEKDAQESENALRAQTELDKLIRDKASASVINAKREEVALLIAIRDAANEEDLAAAEAKFQAFIERRGFEREGKLEQELLDREQLVGLRQEFEELDAEDRARISAKELKDFAKTVLTRKKAEANVAKERLKIRIDERNSFLTEEAKFGTGIATLRALFRKTELQNAKQAADILINLQQSKNTTLRSIGKAAAIANIVYTTPQTAINAYNALAGIPIVGPVLGLAAATAAIAFGAEQLGAASRAQTGGIVGGAGSGQIRGIGGIGSGDRQNILAERGEIIIPKPLAPSFQAQFGLDREREEALATGGGGGGDINITIDTLIGTEQFVNETLIPMIKDAREFDNADIGA